MKIFSKKGAANSFVLAILITAFIWLAENSFVFLSKIVLPANPTFYHRPTTVESVVDTVVSRVLDHLGVVNKLSPRWKAEPE